MFQSVIWVVYRQDVIGKEDHGPSIFTCPARTVDVYQIESLMPQNGKYTN